ncbi:hypothetical protein PAECIP111893_03911 [Paenibacillus plantiphilus]|uniref:Uncharacterized protein n=1 Tax=Paenibacillus plantiphilus TaxID=2905650 RepID=A0ABM9CK47_9BACL|nr:hypothetical protein [Paenibacillus plantiphilus]CAH1215284.1 hypothetical protein PAECIP111893_03911 [Paenibacillus plantiphilus]
MLSTRRSKLALSSVLLMIMIAGYIGYSFYLANGPRQSHYLGVQSISLDEERIGAIRLLQPATSITTLSNARVEHERYDYYDASRGLRVAVEKESDAIVRIILSEEASTDLATTRGAGIHDSKQRLISLYGPAYYERSEQGAAIIGYVDQHLNQTLEFWLHDGEVTMIRLDLGDMD